MKESKGNEIGGIAFIGSIFVGVGLGILYNHPAIGTLLGIGVGFILMALIRAMVEH